MKLNRSNGRTGGRSGSRCRAENRCDKLKYGRVYMCKLQELKRERYAKVWNFKEIRRKRKKKCQRNEPHGGNKLNV